MENGMKVQAVKLDGINRIWLVISQDGKPVKPISQFIRYLYNIDKSPHTLRAYANHLKLYWDYLTASEANWSLASVDVIACFVGWLRQSAAVNDIITLNDASAKRQSRSINAILSCVASFYCFHKSLGHTEFELTEEVIGIGGRYKAMLHHVFKNKTVTRRIISLRTTQDFPKILKSEQIDEMISSCRNSRDRFLILLLYQTGLRIGQALTLYHEDIVTWDNKIKVIYRDDHPSGYRNKSRKTNSIDISNDLSQSYSTYASELSPPFSNYVFIDYKKNKPLTYDAVKSLFIRLSNKLKIKITPHMLRHTHATQLIKDGWEPHLVQKRLGHASIQTTLDIYTHFDDDDLKQAYQKFTSKRKPS